VRSFPAELGIDAVPACVTREWGFDVASAEFAPLGAGSYHWVLTDAEGSRAFATVDDLDVKSWLGDTREAVFDGLEAAFDTAASLRAQGLDFVVAPIPTHRGENCVRVAPRYAVALFPFVDGRASDFGEHDPADLPAVAALLAELHGAQPGPRTRTAGLELPGRRHIESALRELREPWPGGPYAERAREALAAHAADVADLLELADRLAASIAARGAGWVVTHGEPHTANVMHTGDGLALIDWDTVALAPPERDLWMVAGAAADADAEAIDYFRLMWDLKDLAEWLDIFRRPHEDTDDTARSYRGLREVVASRDRWL
jgi:spectinomycin phosphotransferase